MKIKNPKTVTYQKFGNKVVNKYVKNTINFDCHKNVPSDAKFYFAYKNIPVIKNYGESKDFKIDIDRLKELNITNLQCIGKSGVRGESLSADRNYKFIPKVKECGIETIIDLRTADHTDKFKAKCQKFGLNYIHIPIDSKVTSDREILDNLPTLFKAIEDGKFYIACAQGKHRTDIAFAINYLFNPKHPPTPPKMYGHVENGKMRSQDIFRRANSLLKSMTPEDKATLGWNEKFEQTFKQRKQKLIEFNEQ